MEVFAIQTQNKEEQVHVYESLKDGLMPQRRRADVNTAPTVAKHGDNDYQKKILVTLCVICVAFGTAIVTLSVVVYSRNISFERSIDNQNRNCMEYIAAMNATFTSILASTKQETRNQSQKLADVVSDVRLNHNSTTENAEKMLLFMEKESSKNKVSLTACARGETYSSGDFVLFIYIYTRNSINSQVISSLKDTGIFTCERSGLYLISISMTTSTRSTVIYLYKNSTAIAYLYFSLNGYPQTNSATIVENMAIGDTLTVKPGGTMYIGDDRESCISVLQLSN